MADDGEGLHRSGGMGFPANPYQTGGAAARGVVMRGGLPLVGYADPPPSGMRNDFGGLTHHHLTYPTSHHLHASTPVPPPPSSAPPMSVGFSDQHHHMYSRPVSLPGARVLPPPPPPAYGAPSIYPPQAPHDVDQVSMMRGARGSSVRPTTTKGVRDAMMESSMSSSSGDPPRKRGKHLMERLLWNGSFLRCPGKNCQGIVERASEPRHGEMLDCSVRGCNRKLFYCAYCHRAYVIVTEPDWTLGEHGLEICHMADKESKRRIVEEACEKYRREHPGSKRYPPWQRKDIDDILLIREEPGFLTFRIPIWSEQELEMAADFLQQHSSSSLCGNTSGTSGGSASSTSTQQQQQQQCLARGDQQPRPLVPRLVIEVLQRLHDVQLERMKERSQGDADSSSASSNTNTAPPPPTGNHHHPHQQHHHHQQQHHQQQHQHSNHDLHNNSSNNNSNGGMGLHQQQQQMMMKGAGGMMGGGPGAMMMMMGGGMGGGGGEGYMAGGAGAGGSVDLWARSNRMMVGAPAAPPAAGGTAGPSVMHHGGAGGLVGGGNGGGSGGGGGMNNNKGAGGEALSLLMSAAVAHAQQFKAASNGGGGGGGGVPPPHHLHPPPAFKEE